MQSESEDRSFRLLQTRNVPLKHEPFEAALPSPFLLEHISHRQSQVLLLACQLLQKTTEKEDPFIMAEFESSTAPDYGICIVLNKLKLDRRKNGGPSDLRSKSCPTGQEVKRY